MRDIHIAGPWITDVEKHYVNDALDRWYGKDAYYYVELFEQEFSKYIGRRYCLMTPNATSALHLIIKSLGIDERHEVIVPDLTWIATVAPVVYERITPVFCDVDRTNWCVSIEEVERHITGSTRAVIAVDLHGNMPDLFDLEDLCFNYGISLIEDSAQALGSEFFGKKAGSFGKASVFSFHRTKTLVTGEGGVLVTDDAELYETAKMFRDHGRVVGDKPYYNRVVGYKYMPTNILAALAYGQLTRIEELIAKKRWIFNAYRERLGHISGLTLNQDDSVLFNGVWVTGLVWDESFGKLKGQIMSALEKYGVPPRPFFYPLSSLPAFVSVKHRRGSNQNSYWLSDHGINLPCALDLDEEQIEFICKGVETALNG